MGFPGKENPWYSVKSGEKNKRQHSKIFTSPTNKFRRESKKGRSKGENQYSGKKNHNCRITENIRRKKEFLCLYILEKEKLHLLTQGDATVSIFQLQGSCTESYNSYSSYTETELSHSHWTVSLGLNKTNTFSFLKQVSVTVLNSNGWLHELVGAFHLRFSLRNSSQMLMIKGQTAGGGRVS